VKCNAKGFFGKYFCAARISRHGGIHRVRAVARTGRRKNTCLNTFCNSGLVVFNLKNFAGSSTMAITQGRASAFPMERKMVIIIVSLTAGLMLGGFALAWKNRDMLLASMRGAVGNQQWIQIQPRTDDGQNKDGSLPAAAAPKDKKAAAPAGKKTTAAAKTGTQTKSTATKLPALQVQWCDTTGARVKVPGVIINEVAWMGTPASYADEWIELKNLFRENVSLEGWQLQNKNKGIKITFKTGSVVPVGGFYLLERTDDATVPDVLADTIYTGSLANSNDALYLFDNYCGLQDTVAAAPAWPAGDNASKRTMERTSGLLWKTSVIPGGTPKLENSAH
jgi:hypothetical protein